MILYFDSFITDIPLHKNKFYGFSEVRSSVPNYKMPSKLEIAMYTLASYSVIPWSKVIIKYELSDTSKNSFFESFIKKIYPNAILIRGRSDTASKFIESIDLLKKFGDEWVFYAGNNDHPFVAPNLNTLNACLDKVKELKKKYPIVTIGYSHFSESQNMGVPGMPNHELVYPDCNILEETDSCLVLALKRPVLDAIQIVHISTLEKWFCNSLVPKDKRVVRSEDFSPFVTYPEHILVVPKKEICSHFDGYAHTKSLGFLLPLSLVPPLFIPPGFFQKDIKIAYGFEEYREGWVNVNPKKELFSFQDPTSGTDLKLDLPNLPLFWKNYTSKIEVNNDVSLDLLSSAYEKWFQSVNHPWPKRSKAYYFFVRIKLILAKLVLRFF